MVANRWLLPDGFEEVLPPDARDVERLRQRLLGLYDRWGYDLVMPSIVEFTDSLLTGTANSLHRKTFTLVDQVSGRQMGLRSDMTPQVARIDAHQLALRQPVSRLCYCGPLVHARTDGLNPSRSPLQIGAEIFGAAGIEADIEVVSLMIETLRATPLEQISLDLGHVGLFRSLFEQSGLDKSLEATLFDMLQRKAIPELKNFLAEQVADETRRNQFCQLALLNGDVSIIDEALQHYCDVSGECVVALEQIRSVALGIQARYPQVLVHCDLSELRGYEYHTGLVFAAFLPGQGREIARGGRYDDIGSVFGIEARPATGFSTDLVALYQLAARKQLPADTVLAPDDDDPVLLALINSLRESGRRVWSDLAGDADTDLSRFSERIVREGKDWVVKKI